MKKLFFVLSILIAAMVACNSAEEMPNLDVSANNNNVEDLVRAFANKVNNTPEYKLIITGKTVDRYIYTGKGQNMTISASTAPLTRALSEDEFEISTVTFTIDDNEGFAVVGRTGEFTKVYYFTDNGTVESAREIVPVEIYLDEIPRYCVDDLASGAGGIGGFPWGPTPDTTDIAYVDMNPIVKTKWGQRAPYNNLIPYCSNPTTDAHPAHRCPAGCCGIAICQFMVTVGGSITINGWQLDLSSLGTSATPSSSQYSQVAYLVYWVATGINTNFGCSRSGANMQSVRNFLNNHNYPCNLAYGAINDSIVHRHLHMGYPHIMAGFDNTTGHCWLVDGIKGPASNPYYHCNWGWSGNSDGWVAGNPFTAPGRYEFSSNNQHIYLTNI